jgi:aspartate kinase
MNVMKFGGTSVGSAARMNDVSKIIDTGKPVLVVLSAVSGTTNKLVEIADLLTEGKKEEAKNAIANLENSYDKLINDLYKEFPNAMPEAVQLIVRHFELLNGFTRNGFGKRQYREILAQGELISTGLFDIYLRAKGKKVFFMNALDFMRTDENHEPDMKYIEENLKEILHANNGYQFYLTQGYICRNSFGEIDNLKRGGSDYSASIIGSAMKADEIQIWTDIDGMHNNDPRIVEGTFPIRELSFDEAAELAYFGAKILHPSSVNPARAAGIPVRLKNTMQPEAPGTLISKNTGSNEIKAIAAKDNIIAIKINSGRMLMAYGFLRNVFEIFERYATPIDVITTSEVAVSVTIDNDDYLKEIVKELESFGSVETDRDQTIICIVGDGLANQIGYAARIFDSLKDINVRMISCGGSKNNVSLVVNHSDKNKALKSLNEGLFKKAALA